MVLQISWEFVRTYLLICWSSSSSYTYLFSIEKNVQKKFKLTIVCVFVCVCVMINLLEQISEHEWKTHTDVNNKKNEMLNLRKYVVVNKVAGNYIKHNISDEHAAVTYRCK